MMTIKILKDAGHTDKDIKHLIKRNITTPLLCPHCGVVLHWNGHAFPKTCGKEECVKAVRVNTHKQTCLKKYGTESHFHDDKIRNKIKTTVKEKYGVDNIAQVPEIMEKSRQTCIERHGVAYSFQLQSVRDKAKEVCLEKYGVNYHFQNESIKDKAKESILEKYGFETPFLNEEVKEKMKQTCLERYGVEHMFQNEDYRQKAVKTLIERYGSATPSQNTDIAEKMSSNLLDKSYEKLFDYDSVIPLFSRNEWFGHGKGFVYKWKCKECGFEFESKICGCWHIPICRKCHPYSISSGQEELTNYIQSIYNGTIIKNDRVALNGKEIDVYLPDLKIGFEFNGDYWHSNEFVHKNYHVDKTTLAESVGIHLIQIYEFDWNSNKEFICSNILDLINDNFNEFNFITINENNEKIADRRWISVLNHKIKSFIDPIVIYERPTFKVYDCGKIIIQ